jgi:hypothetical protein
MKTTVEIADGLLSEAKRYAAARGLTLKEVIETALRETLEVEKSRRRPFRLQKHSFKGRGLAAEGEWPAIRKEIYRGRGE